LCSLDTIVHDLKNLLKRVKSQDQEYVSLARYPVSKPQQRIMLKKIKRYRLAYCLQRDGMVRRDIASNLTELGMYGFRKNGMPQEPDLREVTRDIAQARNIISHVEKGVFP
jgi:hypothetical protein